MPAHFGKVVDDEQREDPGDSKEFMPQIEQKRTELQQLIAKREAAFFDVLTAAQKRQVEELRAESEAKRESATSANSDADATPAKSKAKSKAAKSTE
jgi:hypothetical protein